MPRCRSHVKPVTVYVYNAELRTHTRRTVAFRVVCSCGARGPARRTIAGAREAFAERAAHR